MSGLPAPAARALDAALVSLPAYLVLDWLVRHHPAAGTLSRAVMATGLDVSELARAVRALADRGVLVTEGGELRLSEAYAPGLLAAWRRLRVDATLRRRAAGLAADREECGAQVFLKVGWVPRKGAPTVAITPPPAPPTLAVSVPGVPGPTRSGGPAAPVA